jgi:hypothetical protein
VKKAQQRANKRVQPTGWIGAILASRCDKKIFSIYQCCSFQPAADAQAVRPHITRSSFTSA